MAEEKCASIKLYRDNVPRITITYKNKKDLYKQFQKKLKELNLDIGEVYWADWDNDRTSIKSADDLLAAVDNNTNVRMFYRSKQSEKADKTDDDAFTCPSCDEEEEEDNCKEQREKLENEENERRAYSRSPERRRHRSRSGSRSPGRRRHRSRSESCPRRHHHFHPHHRHHGEMPPPPLCFPPWFPPWMDPRFMPMPPCPSHGRHGKCPRRERRRERSRDCSCDRLCKEFDSM